MTRGAHCEYCSWTRHDLSRVGGECLVVFIVQNQISSEIDSDSEVHAPRTTRRPEKLEASQYHGKEAENLDHWILSVDTAVKAQLITERSLQVSFAISYLRGRAKDWAYSLMSQNPRCFPNLEEFNAKIRTALLPPNTQMKLRLRLLSCKQGKRSLHKFVQDMRTLRAGVTDNPLDEPRS